MSDAARRAEVLALARKLRTAKTGSTEGLLSAEDMHLAVVALNHFDESAEFEYAVHVTYPDGRVGYLSTHDWGGLINTQRNLANREEMWGWQKVANVGKIVKRRKAGGIEDV